MAINWAIKAKWVPGHKIFIYENVLKIFEAGIFSGNKSFSKKYIHFYAGLR